MFGLLKKIFGGDPANSPLKPLVEKGAMIIDVRTPREYSQGHVNGSINIPLQSINQQVAKIKSYNKPVITCCRSGHRSGQAAGLLKKAGVEVYNGGSWGTVNRIVNS